MKSCGGCTACCHIVPVRELKLRAWQGCPHEMRMPAAKVGCAIYPTRPGSCAIWNCQWHAEPGWADDMRPDRVGVVVDIMPDTLGLRDETTGKVIEKAAMQFWVERGHEEDWRDRNSPVQDLIGSVCATGMAVLWRTFDPVHGQIARAFWFDENGQRCTADPQPPTRNRSDVERLDDALALMAKRA
jgi:hypothetical protein